MVEFNPETFTLIMAVRLSHKKTAKKLEALGVKPTMQRERLQHGKTTAAKSLLVELTNGVKTVSDEFFTGLFEQCKQLVPCRHCVQEITEKSGMSDLDVLSTVAAMSCLDGVNEGGGENTEEGGGVQGVKLMMKLDEIGHDMGKKANVSRNVGILDFIRDKTSSEGSELAFYLFSYLNCKKAAVAGAKPFLYCPVGNISMRLSFVAPDLAMTDVPHLDNVVLKEKLGEGGQAVVYRGVLPLPQDSDGEKDLNVAVKLFKGKPGGSYLESFIQEVYIMSSLNHVNLVRMHGLCLKPRLGMIIEYIQQNDLQMLLELETKGELLEDITHPDLKDMVIAKKESGTFSASASVYIYLCGRLRICVCIFMPMSICVCDSLCIYARLSVHVLMDPFWSLIFIPFLYIFAM